MEYATPNLCQQQIDYNKQKHERRRSMMDITRAWKDEEYRLSLSEEERALLLGNPAGLLELSDAELESIMGGDPISVVGGGAEATCVVSIGNATAIGNIGGSYNTGDAFASSCTTYTIVFE
jgi:mersacidin/lichenicidin family type 2 lantibiotic